jgi:uncharacterized coiled-coil protein SlyX
MSDCRHCTPCALERIERALSRMELAMARETDALNEIKTKLADVHADVRAKLDEVRGELSAEGQTAIDEVNEALQSFDDEIGDADGSDVPPPAEENPPAGDGSDATPTA